MSTRGSMRYCVLMARQRGSDRRVSPEAHGKSAQQRVLNTEEPLSIGVWPPRACGCGYRWSLIELTKWREGEKHAGKLVMNHLMGEFGACIMRALRLQHG